MKSIAAICPHLQSALDTMGTVSACALLDYPHYVNLGDHLLWLGNLFYLREKQDANILYAASFPEFSPERLDEVVGDRPVPLLLSGGGNLGDVWHRHQQIRERIIQAYRDRQIVILPQTLYFRSSENLKRTARIFNAHPSLRIFVRDLVSYSIAKENFHRCQVELAPDTALQLGFLKDFPMRSSRRGILYHCRTDTELLTQVNLPQLPLPVERRDWMAYEEKWMIGRANTAWKQALATGFRAGWQRGARHPQEWWSRQSWEQEFYPRSFRSGIYDPLRQRQSWSFIHSAVYQFRQYQLIITNRLHGHILATLLDIPHVFLPNSYHKNEAFYNTWTKDISYCRFVKDPREIRIAVADLLEHT